jgi:hypothetical protein
LLAEPPTAGAVVLELSAAGIRGVATVSCARFLDGSDRRWNGCRSIWTFVLCADLDAQQLARPANAVERAAGIRPAALS